MTVRGGEKGASFEREIAKRLSRWISRGGRDDLYWRTAMSGGRATIANRSGGNVRAQLGDLTSIDAEGSPLTDKFVIELKHHKDVALDSFIVKNTGPIPKWWEKVKDEAYGSQRLPMLIFKQNRLAELLAVDHQGSHYFPAIDPLAILPSRPGGFVLYVLDDVLGEPPSSDLLRPSQNMLHGSL